LLTVDKNDDLQGTRCLGERAWEIRLSSFPKSPTDYGVLAQEGKTDFALNNPRMRTSGYLKYEFWIM
jgi:hypothetical protein